MKNKLPDLRDHLFATIEGLLDEEKPLDIARANAVANVAGQLIESAKVEVAFMKVVGNTTGSGFIQAPEGTLQAPAPKQLTGGSRPASPR